jgi:hypothetical protein
MWPVTTIEATHPIRLGFMPESQAIDDPDRPGLRRAGPRAAAPYGDERVEFHQVPAVDLLRADPGDLDLHGAGFDSVDLTGIEELQRTCADVLAAGAITDAQASAIRTALDGAVLPTTHGPGLRVLHIADEGLIMRTGGPNGLSLVGPRSVGMNGHGQATSIHVDQDVYGTPLLQIMNGRAPSLFVHDSPDGSCADGSMLLVNLWIPLRQIVLPLVLADGRSLDRRRHQLRYGLATGSFLDRNADQEINDIYTLLHDEGQRWYFRSEMDHRSGWVFNTLSAPHGAGVLPGEDSAERCYLALEAAGAAVAARDAAALEAAVAEVDVPPSAMPQTDALRAAVEQMDALLDVARDDPARVIGTGAAAWSEAAALARGSVVRTSLEMRLVVTVDPDRTA